jgi:glycosyltransferase involved in cell wall biosynthesis
MGKKSKSATKTVYPFVSVCTPTFNRRPFYPMIIQCFNNQDYPKDKIEWIIVDDGTDKIHDLIQDIPQVKYFSYEKKMSLGQKRNLMHDKCSGDIILYMDDDDYYPEDRISHAVETLQNNPHALCAGSSEMYIYFKHIEKMYKCGPYGPNHSTAATFAFRKELLKQTRYDDEAELAEEKSFLKNYTIPFVQLNSLKSILVFSHNHNSFDKKMLLEQSSNPFVQESNLKVSDFVKDEKTMKFFLEDVDNLLENYSPGKPENKPNVLKQIEEIKQKKEEITLIHQLQQSISVYEQRLAQITHENIKLAEKNDYLQKKITGLIQEKISFLKEQKEKEEQKEKREQ